LTTIDLVDVERERGLPASARNIDLAYRRALRHSRHVRWLRATVLAGIALVLLSVVAANYMPPVGGFHLPAELSKLVIHGTKITMAQPRLNGFTSDSRAYEFTASSAAQDITSPDVVELLEIRAKMEMADQSMVRMSADSGLYNMKADTLTLSKNIHLVSTTGYEARLSQAVVDVHEGGVVSNQPVWVKLLNGFLNAKGLEIAENGDVIRFHDVTMVMQPGSEQTKSGEP
jgi:lipopolysaccharide export system protein LptC